MKKILALLVAGVMAVSLFTACGNSSKYKDGSFEGQSTADDRGAVGKVKLTISKGKITEVDYKGVQKDGSIKDENYGKTNGKIENQANYDKAQLAVKSYDTYEKALIDKQDVEKVDAVSGATSANKQFKEAVNDALAKAKK